MPVTRRAFEYAKTTMSFLRDLFSMHDPSDSIGRIVLAGRRYRAWSRALSVVVLMTTGLLYLQLIWPAFLSDDLSNPAIGTLIASESFQERVRPIFDHLNRYNHRTKGESIAEPDDFHYIDGQSQFGLQLTAHYKAFKRPVSDVAGHDATDGASSVQYAYRPEFSVRIAYPALIVFSMVVCIELGIMAMIFVRRPRAQINFEEQVLDEFFHIGEEPQPTTVDVTTQLARLQHILENFHAFCKQLGIRHAGRPGFEISDEYDVQDILRALLMLHFSVVKPEEHTPAYAGRSSRIDFLLHHEEIAVEVKMTRETLRDKEIADELILDIARYATHPKCKRLVCFIYDPKELLRNPGVLRNDLTSAQRGMSVDVVVSPSR
ncbi:hypothetical protein [Burkholderia ubonensis]|uniref:PD-(D/E)XK nuclease domain-containing protein n=1 Tax=Burkholderia ubonensis TaxID=101571 RepID=UPI000A7195AB|nr:hypothetical protein [Burkholderia ubonensis]